MNPDTVQGDEAEGRCAGDWPLLMAPAMATDPFTPETVFVDSPRVACDGATDISPALGHPRVYLQIDEKGFVDCGYCDKRFVLTGGAADNSQAA
jgi:uncharacterized Zn-finger protein